MTDLRLDGCRSKPLIGYLKALGLLRTVSEQVDNSARGRWQNGVFELRSTLDEEGLTRFLLGAYAPSPVVSPWNGGSGFFPKDRQDAIVALEQANDPRLSAYREAIRAARKALSHLDITVKPEPGMKLRLIRELRRTLSDAALPWLDVAIIVTGEKVSYPPLLGSGGNDGRYDFSNNYAQAVVNCLLSDAHNYTSILLSSALTGEVAELQRKLSLGHFSRDASPSNSPYGEADNLGNPWDLILAIEGTLVLVAGAARRLGIALSGALVAPFTVYSTAVGYGSAASGEGKKPGVELWLPLWSSWATAAEISNLARESRAQLGRGPSRRQARTGLDFARAAGRLGVARGIGAFERYAILERAGQSSLAVPAGRISVSERTSAQAIGSIGAWLDSILRFAAHEKCPSAVQVEIRKLEHAAFELASHGGPDQACATLEAMGATEHVLARSRPAIEAGVRPLRPVHANTWVETADDGTPEFAVAASLASLRNHKPGLPALRDYLHGTTTGRKGVAFDAERRHLVNGNSVAALLAAVHARRHLDVDSRGNQAAAERTSLLSTYESDHDRSIKTGKTETHLFFTRGTWCRMRLARLFAAGRLDEERILRLVWGLALLDHSKHGTHGVIANTSTGDDAVEPTFDVLALAWRGTAMEEVDTDSNRCADSTQKLEVKAENIKKMHIDGKRLGPRRGMAARLAAGALSPVVADAMLRLRMAGLPAIFTKDDLLTYARADLRLGPRLGAALLLPLYPSDLRSTAHRITVPDNRTRVTTRGGKPDEP